MNKKFKKYRSPFQSSVEGENVKHNGGDNYSLQLPGYNGRNDSISIFMNGGICAVKPKIKGGYSELYPTVWMPYYAVHCDFLGEIRCNTDMVSTRNFVKIKKGWFSSIYVSHNALVCLKDLGMPLNNKNDWKEAYEKKDQVLKHIVILKAKEKKVEKIVELNYLTKKFGADAAGLIWISEIWQGMTKDMLLHSRGEPGDIEETIYKTKTKANYFYDSYTTSHNNIKYKLRISLENDIVVGWKDLD